MNIHNFLNNYPSKTVIYCMGNKNVTKIIQNLIECSNRIDNKIILFAFDSEISEACKNLCQVVNMYPYGEPYTKIGNIYYQKLLIANEII